MCGLEGTRSRGRQRITFLDSLSSFVTGNNKDNIALVVVENISDTLNV